MSGTATITISRQLGSGGSYLGQKLASALGFRYVDREVLARAAAELNLAEDQLASREERLRSFWERMLDAFGSGSPDVAYIPPPLPVLTDHRIFTTEARILGEIAAETDCVIIGRAGFCSLPPSPRRLDLFVHAPLDFRVARVMELYGAANEGAARQLIEDSDRARRRYVSEMTGADWRDAANYDLCVDSSRLPLDDLADLMLSFVRQALAQKVAV